MPPFRKSKPKVTVCSRFNGTRFVKRKTYKLKKSHFLADNLGAKIQTQLIDNQPETSSTLDLMPEVPHVQEQSDAQCSAKYMKYKVIHEDLWKGMEDELLVASYALEEQPISCCVCGEAAIYRCTDCGPYFNLCCTCLGDQHNARPFHSLEKWENGMWIRYCHPSLRVLSRDGHECDTAFIRKLTVFNHEGRAINCYAEFCNCEPMAVTVTRWRLWPAQARNVTVCCCIELLEWMRFLLFECHVSQQGFIDAVALKNALTHEEKCMLQRMLDKESLYVYRHVKYQQETLAPEFDDGTKCPACPSGEDCYKPVISLDGNFGLVKKRSSGTSCHKSRHGSRLFIDEDEVTAHLTQSQDDSSKQNSGDCNSFKAGDKVRSKVRSSKLDVTGVFGAICRHEVPQLFLNLRHGERLVYPSMLLSAWFDRNPHAAQANVFYDIACVFSKYLYRNDKSLFEKVKLAIPVFHCYGHKALCQVTYSPRRLPDFGRSDGECLERLWSFARRFNTITKEMTAAHRQDLLTDIFLHYAKKKKANIAQTLRKRYSAAQQEASSCQEQLEEMQKNFSVTAEMLTEWQTREKNLLGQEKDAHKISEKPQCWQEEYILLLQKLILLRSQMAVTLDTPDPDIADQIKELQIKISAFENKHSISRRWKEGDAMFQQHLKAIQLRHKERLLRQLLLHARERMFLLSLKKKYPGGQTMANRISRQITLASKKITKLAKVYNGASFSTGTLDRVAADDLMDPTSRVYTSISGYEQNTQSSIPTAIQREMLDLHFRQERTLEEQRLLKQEMNSVCRYYIMYTDTLNKWMEQEVHSGKLSLMKKLHLQMQQAYNWAVQQFQDVCPDLPDTTLDINLSLVNVVPASSEEVELLEPFFNQESSDDSSGESCDEA